MWHSHTKITATVRIRSSTRWIVVRYAIGDSCSEGEGNRGVEGTGNA